MSATQTKPVQPAGVYNASEQPPKPAVEPDLLDAVLSKVVVDLDRTAQRYAAATVDPARSRLERMILMADGIERLPAKPEQIAAGLAEGELAPSELLGAIGGA